MSAQARRKKIGLALSGGAARGMAHIGVMDVLLQEGIPIDIIAGTSAGAVVGAIYAAHQDISRVTKDALEANWIKMAPMIDLSLRSGLIKGKRITDMLTHYVGGNTKFSDLQIPFACVATDIDTGEEVVMDEGLVAEALRASISIPTLFTVVKREGRYLVDGGLTTPVPIHVVKKMGADFVIAVNVTPDVIARTGKTGQMPAGAQKEPHLFHVMLQSLYITTYGVVRHSLENADIVIEPDLASIGAADFQKARELIKRGRQAARQAMPEIKRKLNQP